MIVTVILCVLVEAIFTAMEVSFGAVPVARLRAIAHNIEDDPKAQLRAHLAQHLSERHDQLTLLFLTVTCVTMWTAASTLLWWLWQTHHSLWWMAPALIPILFVAEVLPLAVAARFAESVVVHSARFLNLILTITWPLLWLISIVAKGAGILFGARQDASMHVTEDEVRSAIATAGEEGVLEQNERDMLELAMDFRTKLVREVMTPRPDIMAIPDDLPLQETLERGLAAGRSRLPVYQESLDKIVGLLAIKDLIPLVRDPESDLSQLQTSEIVRPAYFVPEDKHIASTLEEMRRRRMLMAVVVDDEGTTTGIVTVEDLLEELVGEIQDEYDHEEPDLQLLEGGVSCDASVSVREFGRFWEKQFECTPDFKTRNGEAADESMSLAALALDLFDGVPELGAAIAAGEPQLQITVQQMDGPRIEKVLLTRKEGQQ